MKDIFNIFRDNLHMLYPSIRNKVIQSILAAAIMPLLYWGLKGAFDGDIDATRIWWIIVAMWGFFIIRAIFALKGELEMTHRVYDITYNMRLKLGEHLRRVPMGFFSRKNTGELNNAVIEDVNSVEAAFSHSISDISSVITLPFFIGLFLFFIDWRMALATWVIVPFGIPLVLWIQRIAPGFAHKKSDVQAEAVSSMLEYLQGIKVLKALNLTGARFSRVDNAFRRLRNVSLEVEGKPAPLILGAAAVIDLGFSILIMLGAYLFFGGSLNIAQYFMFLIISLRLYAPIIEIIFQVTILRFTGTGAERVKNLLAEPYLPEPEVNPVIDRYDIEFRNVSFGYEGTPVLKDVSFTISEHSMTALVGPSGAGKTTITSLIARFWDVDSGQVLIGGQDIKGMQCDAVLSDISMVFQDVQIFNDTIYENIKIGKKDASREEVITASKAALCHEFIESLPRGYDTMVGEGGSTLSGGEKQRISIARAILKDAPIVLLDEATASLDPENELLIQKAIRELVQSKTLVVIAHRLPTIAAADQILVIDQNHIAEKGNHADLLAMNGLYSKLWNEQIQAKGWKLGVA